MQRPAGHAALHTCSAAAAKNLCLTCCLPLSLPLPLPLASACALRRVLQMAGDMPTGMPTTMRARRSLATAGRSAGAAAAGTCTSWVPALIHQAAASAPTGNYPWLLLLFWSIVSAGSASTQAPAGEEPLPAALAGEGAPPDAPCAVVADPTVSSSCSVSVRVGLGGMRFGRIVVGC